MLNYSLQWPLNHVITYQKVFTRCEVFMWVSVINLSKVDTVHG